MAITKLKAESFDLSDDFAFTGNVTGAGGILVADNWRITSSVTSDTNPLTNWERVDSTEQGTIGSAMNFSSGNFTFPSTGIWFVSSSCIIQEGSSTDQFVQFTMSFNGNDIMQIYQETALSGGYNAGYNSTLLDVTDTSHILKFRFVNVTASAALRGSSTENVTNATFIRLGDT